MSPQIAPSLPSRSFGRRSERVLRYELNVVASTTAAVVSGLGGWLFDRRMAGWNVGVALTDPAGDRALDILGVKPVELDGVWRALSGETDGVAMTVIATDRFESDDTVRAHGLDALRLDSGELAFWGGHCPELVCGQFQQRQYLLSAAARAFKAHALTATGLSATEAGPREIVFRAGPVGGVRDLFDVEAVGPDRYTAAAIGTPARL